MKDKVAELKKWEDIVQSCTRCPLSEGRINPVFGGFNSEARVFLVGEAPGKNEDLQGVPFVGASGKNLDEYLSYANLTRDDIYIGNVLKCRPPQNRNPKPAEIESCSEYLRAQVALVHPEIIVPLGNFATKFILRTDKGITGLHGQLVSAGDFNVLPMFHPAAAIYDRKKRQALIDDFTLLGQLLKESENSREL